MNLFEMNNGVLQIQPEAYALEPFKVLWTRDKTKNKDNAIKELSFIYFMVDFTSDFADILEDSIREVEVKKSLNLETSWKPDKLVQSAMDFYRSRQETVALKLLEDSRLGISKLSNYIRDINFNAYRDWETTTLSLSVVWVKTQKRKNGGVVLKQ